MIQVAYRIVADNTICSGKPVIAGTRIPVALIVDELAAGETLQSILDEYDLRREDVLAALRFVARKVDRRHPGL